MLPHHLAPFLLSLKIKAQTGSLDSVNVSQLARGYLESGTGLVCVCVCVVGGTEG